MATFRTRTEYINNLYVSTYAESIGGLRDQVFDATKSAFWAILRNKGGLMSVNGGDYIKFNLQVSKNDQLFWLAKGGQTELVDFEFLEQARYKWYRASKPLTQFWADTQKNKSEAEIIDMVTAKIENSMMSFKEDIDAQLFSANDESGSVTANAPPGLQHLVSTAGTGTVGGINSATYSWWQNQQIDFDSGTTYVATPGSPTDTDWLNSGVTAMRDMLKLTKGHTDVIIAPWHIFKLMQDDLLTYFQWNGNPPADLGILTNAPAFDGIPVFWAENCPDGQMYFLDMDSVKFVYDPDDFFTLGQWMPIVNQPNDMIAHITLACSFCVKDRRNNGVMHGLPT